MRSALRKTFESEFLSSRASFLVRFPAKLVLSLETRFLSKEMVESRDKPEESQLFSACHVKAAEHSYLQRSTGSVTCTGAGDETNACGSDLRSTVRPGIK